MDPSVANPKQELHLVLQKHFRVPMEKGMIQYTDTPVLGGFQCTLEIPNLDGGSFVGEVVRIPGVYPCVRSIPVKNKKTTFFVF